MVGLSTSAGGGGPSEPGTVEIEGFAFGPDAVTVAAGATVTWTNLDSATHTVTQNGDALLDSPDIADGDTYEVTFEEAGTYEYFCKFHPAMRASDHGGGLSRWSQSHACCDWSARSWCWWAARST